VALPEGETLDLLTATAGGPHGCVTSVSLRTREGSSFTLGRPQLGPDTQTLSVDVHPSLGRLGGFIVGEAQDFCPSTSGALRRACARAREGLRSCARETLHGAQSPACAVQAGATGVCWCRLHRS
jgi:hypothetical protein